MVVLYYQIQFACVQIRHNPLSGGYCGEVPPLPIPNREVKLTCADGTAMQCGRVGSRLLLSRASDFERFLRLFCFHADFILSHANCFLGHADFADDADFSLLLFLFHTDFTDVRRFLTCSVLDDAEKNWTNLKGQPSLIWRDYLFLR